MSMSKLTVRSVLDSSGDPKEFDNPHGWTSDEADTLNWVLTEKCSCARNILVMELASALKRSPPSAYIIKETSKRIYNNSVKGSRASE